MTWDSWTFFSLWPWAAGFLFDLLGCISSSSHLGLLDERGARWRLTFMTLLWLALSVAAGLLEPALQGTCPNQHTSDVCFLSTNYVARPFRIRLLSLALADMSAAVQDRSILFDHRGPLRGSS